MITLTKAGRYDLREELGRGAMGVVYHGFDPVIGRDVAVKTLHLSEAGTGMTREELVGRFQTEARAAGLLTHPNIVVVYDAGAEQGVFYITMEFVEGKSLQSLIDAHQTFPLPRVMKLMEQVCSALDYAHQHNIVHRDIKPANLMLTADDTVKITDFGTAKILQFGTTQTTHVMGTPSYMSPEQVKGKPVDGRSDIFSLGVILYELLTGEKPFPGQNITTVIYKIINEDPTPPRELDSSIHPGLSAVITRALAKDPGLRYQTCKELLNALKNYHEMTNPEMTIRMASSTPQVAAAPTRPGAAPIRQTEPQLAPYPMQRETSVHIASAVVPESKGPRTGVSVLLALVLLGVIGYAGYRVYPPLMDLWQRAHEASETNSTPAVPSPDTAPATPASDATAKPETQSGTTAQVSTPATNAAAPEVQPIPQKLAHAAVKPAVSAKPLEPPATVAANPEKPEKPVSAPRPLPAANPFAAMQFKSKLNAELAGLPFGNKVKMEASGTALTLTGSLTPAEHRTLLEHLRSVPTGVRIVDDIEYAESQPAATPAKAQGSVGWVWVRSVPPNAKILVDGAETGQRTPAKVEMTDGDHQINLVRQGFGAAQRSVQVHAGQTMQFTEFLQ